MMPKTLLGNMNKIDLVYEKIYCILHALKYYIASYIRVFENLPVFRVKGGYKNVACPIKN